MTINKKVDYSKSIESLITLCEHLSNTQVESFDFEENYNVYEMAYLELSHSDYSDRMVGDFFKEADKHSIFPSPSISEAITVNHKTLFKWLDYLFVYWANHRFLLELPGGSSNEHCLSMSEHLERDIRVGVNIFKVRQYLNYEVFLPLHDNDFNLFVFDPTRTLKVGDTPLFDRFQLGSIIKYIDTLKVGNFAQLLGSCLNGLKANSAYLEQSYLKMCNFLHASLPWANLQGCHLEKSSFIGANLEGAYFDRAYMFKCSLNKVNAVNASFAYINGSQGFFESANFKGASFIGSNLIGANFRWANLERVDFRRTNLTGACLEGADLSGARFDGADLTRVVW
ncbi:MAG: pentapeptide repeat-containing protein [Moorea sp. SIO1G6]|uniref:pentapeptide repeat-containing protein n=1 Tax=Moorena sp. SIO1G6 TaxID=2607840 RepID=UPI0013C05CCE|nr:pentapeptide repeat-containing protein [Moorena sp. SIO1G6]NET68371.1 pentapeptide repeat-containing protein [Moorena sp. SIO1G6]